MESSCSKTEKGKGKSWEYFKENLKRKSVCYGLTWNLATQALIAQMAVQDVQRKPQSYWGQYFLAAAFLWVNSQFFSNVRCSPEASFILQLVISLELLCITSRHYPFVIIRSWSVWDGVCHFKGIPPEAERITYVTVLQEGYFAFTLTFPPDGYLKVNVQNLWKLAVLTKTNEKWTYSLM